MTETTDAALEEQVLALMRDEGLYSVVYDGFCEPPEAVQSWGVMPFEDATFHYPDNDEPFSAQEFIKGSPTRLIMEQIIALIAESGKEPGFEIVDHQVQKS